MLIQFTLSEPLCESAKAICVETGEEITVNDSLGFGGLAGYKGLAVKSKAGVFEVVSIQRIPVSE